MLLVAVMTYYKTIQVTPKEYELLLELRDLLMERGTKAIEEKLENEFKVDEVLREMDRDTLAKGAVVGLAIAMSLHLLKLKEEGEV